MCYDEDKERLGEAEEVITIKNLNEVAIEEYWENNRLEKFDNVLNNCCVVSAQALDRGFEESFFAGSGEGFMRVLTGTGTFLKRGIGICAKPMGSLIHFYGKEINGSTTWTPYTVSGLANYIKEIVD